MRAIVLLMIALLTLISLTLLCVRRNIEALLTFFACTSLALFLLGVLLFIAKKGGFPSQMTFMFFLNNAVRLRLQYMLILLKELGLIVSLGRHLFPLFLLLLALRSVTFIPAPLSKRLQFAAPALPLLTIVLYLQPVFVRVTRSAPTLQGLAVSISFSWVLLYTVSAILLCVAEVMRISIRYVRRRYLQKIAMLIGLAGLYLIYCKQDPAQVYLFYHDDFMWGLGLWYLTPAMGLNAHIAMLGLLLLCSGMSVAYMLRLALIEMREKRETLDVRRKFDMARAGGNIFVHSIKNQLIAQKIVQTAIGREMDKPTPDMDALRARVAESKKINDTMTAHINDLYRIFKEQHLKPSRLPLNDLIARVGEGLRLKYPDALMTVEMGAPCVLLADESVLNEAVLDIVINAWEANVAAGRADQPVAIKCYPSQLYIVIEVADRGEGISRAMQRKVFEPFYTQKNANTNWGMGLYYAADAVRNHYGALRVESEIGRGTSFYIMLPMYNRLSKAGTTP